MYKRPEYGFILTPEDRVQHTNDMLEEIGTEVRELLEMHNGDDRCGCLRRVVNFSLFDPHFCVSYGEYILHRVQQCLNEHPAGTEYRAQREG